ncbi:MAG: class II fructose-bisphosphate aldolase [Bacilli bacterium]|nr:class II fructose-bisphosphate aldolase [Bacilli bacterium]
MLYDLKRILDLAEKDGYAVPAFNVYNLETVMGVLQAAEEARSPVIMQLYSRLVTSGNSDYVCPIVLEAAKRATVPVCLHLDHGSGKDAVTIALRNGMTGIMIDYSTLDLEENIKGTKEVVDMCNLVNVQVEGELGHIGKAIDGVTNQFTEVKDAVKYVKETGVTALAVQVGTAHGRYKQAPVLAIDRIKEIKEATGVHLVLHGGSGVPDDQIKMAVQAGIRKMNFSTDLCYTFIESVQEQDKNKIAIDLIMKEPIEKVKAFCLSKIDVLGSRNKA